ncbi:MAG: mobile mystery protein B [Pseudolabrys sp.]|nr:mobile mystery protein B [Pseudolabrys sp.]
MTSPDDEPTHATPLTAEEREGLIPSHVTLRRELNELEQQNIIDADTWAFNRRHNPLSERFLRGLHRRMFGKVWRWAGHCRTSNKNIGVDRQQIPIGLHEAVSNVLYWIEHNTFPADEVAVRFHHALVFVHPFPNGNGRWSRLAADILTARLGRRRFTWGRSSLRTVGETRRVYIEALKTADNHDFTALIAFARS